MLCVLCNYDDNVSTPMTLANKNVKLLLSGFKVVTGGQYDVDVTLLNPNKEVIYTQVKQQFDSHQFTATVCIFVVNDFSYTMWNTYRRWLGTKSI